MAISNRIKMISLSTILVVGGLVGYKFVGVNENIIPDSIKISVIEKKIIDVLDQKKLENRISSYKDVKCLSGNEGIDCTVFDINSSSTGISFFASSVIFKNFEKSNKFFDSNGTLLNNGETTVLDVYIENILVNDKPLLLSNMNLEQLPDNKFKDLKKVLKKSFDSKTNINFKLSLEQEKNEHIVDLDTSIFNNSFKIENKLSLINKDPKNKNFSISNLKNFGENIVVTNFDFKMSDKNELFSNALYSFYTSQIKSYGPKLANEFFQLNGSTELNKIDFNKEAEIQVKDNLMKKYQIYDSSLPNIHKLIKINVFINKINDLISGRSNSIEISLKEQKISLKDFLTFVGMKKNNKNINLEIK